MGFYEYTRDDYQHDIQERQKDVAELQAKAIAMQGVLSRMYDKLRELSHAPQDFDARWFDSEFNELDDLTNYNLRDYSYRFWHVENDVREMLNKEAKATSA